MWSRLSILAGLVVGVAVAGIVLGGIIAFAPDPVSPSAPVPSFALGSAAPSEGASPTSSTPGASASAPAGGSGALFHVGEPAPALVVPQVGGGTIDLAALRGKPVWINFMATSCQSCQDEFPLMNGFAVRYGDDGLVVIAIDVREEEGAVAAFAQKLDVTFPMGLDVDGSVAGEWGAIALPVHFWIDAEGIVRDGALGGIGPDIMAAGLAKILPGVDVTP